MTTSNSLNPWERDQRPPYDPVAAGLGSTATAGEVQSPQQERTEKPIASFVEATERLDREDERLRRAQNLQAALHPAVPAVQHEQPAPQPEEQALPPSHKLADPYAWQKEENPWQ